MESARHRLKRLVTRMRYPDRKGGVAWKAMPRMLTRLADAEARDDLADW